jgi:TusA-related sulfurtransferase
MAEIAQRNLIGVVLPFCLMAFKSALARVGHGQPLEVLIQDPDAADDLARLVEHFCDRLVARRQIEGRIHIIVERAGRTHLLFKEEA